MAADPIKSCLNIMRRMPPSKIEQNLSGLAALVSEETTDELLQRVDQPLKNRKDESNGKLFLLCDYNRDGESYRSPWSNQYFPALADGYEPSTSLRRLEILANDLFDHYRKLYYEGGLSSVYFWDLEDGFAACFLVHKEVESSRGVDAGQWNSSHVFSVTLKDGKWSYSLTSTILLFVDVSGDKLGAVKLAGSLTRQKQELNLPPVTDEAEHVARMGTMVEEMESSLRQQMQDVYLGKAKEVVSGLRSASAISNAKRAQLASELQGQVMRHAEKRTVDSE